MNKRRIQLVVASANPGKVREFRDALSGVAVEVHAAGDVGIETFPEESGASYEENALLKAGYVALRTGMPTLADDSGLEVDALSGAPGVYSARFGGAGLSDGERIAYLLERMRDVPKPGRGASFVAVVVLATPGGEVVTFRGECRGAILDGPRGEGGFGYDPVFMSADLGKTFAEASLAEKRQVSHRGRALRAFLDWALTPIGKRTMEHTEPRPPDEE